MSREEHEQLLDLVVNIEALVAISGYASDLYADRLAGWRSIEFHAMTHGGPAVETLWMNYPEPTALHDYRYLGTDKTERQRIKRKKQSWTSKLARMPLLERRALMAAIEEFQS